MKIIAHMESDFPTKFGIPHQSGRLEGLKGRIVFLPEYRRAEAFTGIEDYTYLWIIWEFSQAVRREWSPTVRPPRLGGNIRKGVFATRSPYRPNPVGLSSVRLDRLELDPRLGPVLYVSGADLMDGTPIYDIKPYLPYVDSHPDGRGGFTDEILDHRLEVVFPEELLEKIPEGKRQVLLEVLANDPRPGYHRDPERMYGMPFGDQDIHFQVDGGLLRVRSVTRYEKDGERER
ncbi:MAG: tRNA (N6-threonylcarbamoyladenosine(37)-N6)-methyltransferase TrmO [Eubacteriales bacterium]|nr:tRNA (N6-threonylcarbamoyladenosine(37)-N6)-methyltransferase TrmO [Eubacteriales bacterium]